MDDAKFETVKNREAKMTWLLEQRQSSCDLSLPEEEVTLINITQRILLYTNNHTTGSGGRGCEASGDSRRGFFSSDLISPPVTQGKGIWISPQDFQCHSGTK